MTSPEVMAMFNRLRRLPAADRRRALEREACRPETRLELESLLCAHDGVGAFLGAPLIEVPDPGSDRELPDTIAGYAIESLIGHGGMGSVYRASHAATGRSVALKVIRSSTPPRALVRRFAREAVILGRLRHPHIAHVYDAGVHREDRWRIPYLVMERVEGMPLLEYAARHAPSVADRTELLAKVCDAVHYAHQQGVIHRDLKPSNILVDLSTGAASPKVLDFGVARLMGDEQPGATLHTGTGELVGTLRYMSPEQALGTSDEVDTRSDVYALGVIGYELLAGERPYDVDERTIAGAIESIRSAQPRNPVSMNRSCNSDLATVLLTALQRDPAHRYQSASEFASDLRRVNAHEPIAARPPSALYHARKFAARHRALVAATMMVAVLILTAAAIATGEAIRANRARAAEATRFEDVRRLASTLLFDFDPHLIDLPGSLPARRMLVSTGLEYLDRLAVDARSRPDLMLDVARGYLSLGRVQGDPHRANLGDSEGALASYTNALEVLDDLPEPQAEMPIALRARFHALIQSGDVLRRMNRAEEARDRFAEAATCAHRRITPIPDNAQAQRDQSLAWQRLAGAWSDLGDAAKREEFRDRARTSLLELAEQYPEHSGLLRDLAITRLQDGRRLLAAARTDDAIDEFEAFIALAESTEGRFPDRVIARRDLAIACQYLGNAHQSQGNLDAARRQYTRELQLVQALSDADPTDAGALASLAPPLCRLGEVHLAQRDATGARAFFVRYLDTARACVDLDASNSAMQREVGVALYKLGEFAEQFGTAEDAVTWYQRCLEQFEFMREQGSLWASDQGVFDDIRARIAATQSN